MASPRVPAIQTPAQVGKQEVDDAAEVVAVFGSDTDAEAATAADVATLPDGVKLASEARDSGTAGDAAYEATPEWVPLPTPEDESNADAVNG